MFGNNDTPTTADTALDGENATADVLGHQIPAQPEEKKEVPLTDMDIKLLETKRNAQIAFATITNMNLPVSSEADEATLQKEAAEASLNQ